MSATCDQHAQCPPRMVRYDGGYSKRMSASGKVCGGPRPQVYHRAACHGLIGESPVLCEGGASLLRQYDVGRAPVPSHHPSCRNASYTQAKGPSTCIPNNLTAITYPPPLYKLRQSPKLIRPYAYCSLDTGVACTRNIQLPTPGALVQKERIAW